MTGPYDDIIGLPHHVSPTRHRMSNVERGAQFSPFAALTGYGEAVDETARLTESRVFLTGSQQLKLDARLRALAAQLDRTPEVTLTYFKPDCKKSGGAYLDVTGRVCRIDPYAHEVILTDGTAISMEEITDIRSPLLEDPDLSFDL